MKTIFNIISKNYRLNHLLYDNATDKHFAKHSHSLYEMIYVLNGEVEYIIEDKLYTAKKHSLILIKPYTYHYFTIKSNGDYEKIGILFNPDFLNIDISMLNSELQCLDLKNYGIIDAIFQKMDFYYKSFTQEVFLQLYFSLIQEIIFNLSLIRETTTTLQYHTPILSPVLAYINANLFTIRRLEDISTALNISTSYLKAIFKKELKTQPKKYINEKRLLIARQAILSGEKATAVAERCGFQNYSTFYRLYCDYFGYSPSQEMQAP